MGGPTKVLPILSGVATHHVPYTLVEDTQEHSVPVPVGTPELRISSDVLPLLHDVPGSFAAIRLIQDNKYLPVAPRQTIRRDTVEAIEIRFRFIVSA